MLLLRCSLLAACRSPCAEPHFSEVHPVPVHGWLVARSRIPRGCSADCPSVPPTANMLLIGPDLAPTFDMP